MRKIFILFILFSICVVLKQFGILSDSHNSVLLAIGLVLLSAYTLSEIGSSLKLPRVTGYILTGLLLGPFALKILSTNVVKEIEMFNTLAIGLIAITAGLELHFSSLKKVIAPILSTTAIKIILLALTFIGGVFLSNEFVYDFGMPMGLPLISITLVFAALALGTSPSISIAVISEMKAKSRMSQMVLGSAIVKDVVVVIILAVALSFANSVASGGGDMGGSFMRLMKEIGYSLIAGIILGGLFIAYIRFIRQEMFIFIAAMILGTAEISEAIHLELLLVFIMAGIVVRNFSKDPHFLHDALEKVSLPVFVVFFTNVGAGLNLTTTWQFLPVAGILFAARALSFLASSWIAGNFHGEAPGIKNKAWLGYLPQAGVTLGLIQIASRDLSDHAELITNIGIGLVTLNLLVGPVFLRMVLKSEEPDADNTEEEDSMSQKEEKSDLESSETQDLPTSSSYEDDFNLMLHSKAETFEDPYLEKHFLEISNNYFEIFRKNQLFPQKGILTAFVQELGQMEGLSEREIVAKIDDHFKKMSAKGKDTYNSMSQLQKEIDSILVLQKRPFPNSGIYIQKGDSLWIKMRKILRRPLFWFNKKPERDVPLRKIAKYNLEPLIGSFTTELISSWYHLLGRHIEIFQRSLENQNFENQEIMAKIQKENDFWLRTVKSDFNKEFSRCANKWVKHLQQINTPYLSDSSIRYSQVEPEITEMFEKAKSDSLNWDEKFIYCRNRLKVIVQSALLSHAVEKLLEEKFFQQVEIAKSNADTLVKEVFEYFDKINEKINQADERDTKTFEQLLTETKAFAEENLQADLKSKYVRGSFRLLNRDISINLKKSLPKEEGTFQIASENTAAHQVQSPSEIVVKKINLHELFEQSILINFLPVIEERIEGVSNYLESLLMEMEQAFSIINYSLETQIAGEKGSSETLEMSESLQNSIATEREKIEELYNGLMEYIKSSNESTEKLLEECQMEVRQGIERFSVVHTAKNQFRQRLHSTVLKFREVRDAVNLRFKNYYDKLKKLSLQQSDRDIDKTLKKKLSSHTLDTATVREFITSTYDLNTQIPDLPRLYFRLFSLDPIQDRRFFVAHKAREKHFKDFANPESTSSESQKILIIGDRGIGKSSLINVAQMDIETERLIRIEGDDYRGPLAILSRSLNTKNNAASIIATLRRKPATIIIDNVDQMLNRHHLDQFEALFEVINKSPNNTHWIVSLTRFNLESLNRAFKIRSLFSKIIDLNEINLEVAKEVILTRHRLSGLEVEFPKTFMSEFALKAGLSTEDEMFFRVLYERSHGHLRHLIYLWLRSLKSSDGKTIQLSMSKSIDRGLPMIHDFSFLQKQILNQLYCNHSLSVQKMSHTLGLSYSVVDNETQYLEQCHLIKSKGIDRSSFEIPNSLILPIGIELKKEGILQ